MTITWIPEETIWDCDTIADGCPQAGTVYSRRFATAEPVDGLYGVVTVQFYCNDQWEACGNDIEPGELTVSKPVPAEERYRIGQIVEFVTCPDPEWPDEDARFTEYTYKYSWFARADPFSDEQIKALMEKFRADWIYWEWSGTVNLDARDTWAQPVENNDWDEGVQILTEELLQVATDILDERDRRSVEKIGILKADGTLDANYEVKESDSAEDPNMRYQACVRENRYTFWRRRSDAWLALVRIATRETRLIRLAIRRISLDPEVAERLYEAFNDTWTDEEMSQVAVGLCWEQTGYGQRIEYCENPAVGNGTLYCEEHVSQHRLEGIGSGAAGMPNWLPYFE